MAIRSFGDSRQVILMIASSSPKRAGIEPKSVFRGEYASVFMITDPNGNQPVFAHGKGEKHRAVAN